MDININYPARLKKVQEGMAKHGLDLFLGTRGKTTNYLAGAFVPWRSTMPVTRDGYICLNTLLMDAERVKDETWLENVNGCAPLPGMELWEFTVAQIKEMGLDKGAIGLEMGHSPRMIAGYLFATEYEFLKENLPQAKFVNCLELIDDITLVKEPEEVKLMRQAAAIADAAQERVREELYIGINELEIAGIGEMEMRRRGSEFHWPVTGSSEIASGFRTWYSLGGCTPPTDKIVQRNESLLVDMHPTYKQYYSDLSHNYVLGKPSAEQQKLADAYLAACETLIENLKTGQTIGGVCAAVFAELERSGYREFALPGFGHGLGVVGHEWHPAILDNDEFRDIVLVEDIVEVAAMVINVPGVGGMRLETPVRVTATGGEQLCKTPLPLTVLDM